jgi:divalent metal cation (Fe/Co/Zn/Cd) transporter
MHHITLNIPMVGMCGCAQQKERTMEHTVLAEVSKHVGRRIQYEKGHSFTVRTALKCDQCNDPADVVIKTSPTGIRTEQVLTLCEECHKGVVNAN